MPKTAPPAEEPAPRTYQPRGVERRRFSLRLNDELVAWLERVAAKSGRTTAGEIHAVLEDAKRRGWGR